MRNVVILDPAHGKDVKGKRSPDGTHLEYLWSRARISGIIKNIYSVKPNFDLMSPFINEENEPGLTNRVRKYNEIAGDYDNAFMLSIHNDAQNKDQCNNFGWGSARGISVWTSKGENDSDMIATNLFDFLKLKYPNDKFRSAYWLSEKEKVKDPDWEANFTILAGNEYIKTNYDSVLLEWRFQTNIEDVKLLQNKIHNEYFEDTITQWIINEFSKH